MKYQKIDPHLRQVLNDPRVDAGTMSMPDGNWAGYGPDRCDDLTPRRVYRVFRYTDEDGEARLRITRSGLNMTVLARKTSAGTPAAVRGRVEQEVFETSRGLPKDTAAEVAEDTVKNLAASIASCTIEFNESTHFVFALLVECLEELIELAVERL